MTNCIPSLRSLAKLDSQCRQSTLLVQSKVSWGAGLGWDEGWVGVRIGLSLPAEIPVYHYLPIAV
jgi:hypothetical protein